MSQTTILTSSLCAGLIFSMPALGADYKYDNQFCFVAKTTDVIAHADGFKAGNFKTTGIRMGAEGDPFRAMEQHCVGNFTVIGGQQEDNVRCEAENAAGDKVFGVATRKFNPLMPEQSEGSFQIVHGTGKFAGISGEGRSKLVDVITKTPGEMSGCAHSWGTFTIK